VCVVLLTRSVAPIDELKTVFLTAFEVECLMGPSLLGSGVFEYETSGSDGEKPYMSGIDEHSIG